MDRLSVVVKPTQRYRVQVKRDAVRLYETGLSCRVVAERIKVEGVASPHYGTVLRWAKDAGKGRKTHGRRFDLSCELVLALYDRGLHVDEIAQRFSVRTSTIYDRLHEVGAKMRPSRIRYGHVLTEGRLRQLYMEKNSRAQDIAAKVGCNVGTVYNWLRRNGIPLKRPRRAP